MHISFFIFVFLEDIHIVVAIFLKIHLYNVHIFTYHKCDF